MKVIFTGCDEDQKRWGSSTGDTIKLVIGKVYTIRRKEVHQWHTKLYLEEVEGSFNSVCFKRMKAREKR